MANRRQQRLSWPRLEGSERLRNPRPRALSEGLRRDDGGIPRLRKLVDGEPRIDPRLRLTNRGKASTATSQRRSATGFSGRVIAKPCSANGAAVSTAEKDDHALLEAFATPANARIPWMS